MLECISPAVVEQRHSLANRFRTADPFPHLVIDGFFERDFCESLIRTFPPFERGNNINENGHAGRKSTVEDLKSLGDAYVRADELFRSSEFAAFISEATGIPNLLFDPDYIGGGTHENLSGQDLDPHVDFNYHPIRGWHRRLNLIVYLNHEWEDAWGGSLELHVDPWLPPEQNRITRVLPLANRAIVFETSERSWHGFEAIRPPPIIGKISRKSLAIYMYTTERPAAETAPSHSTVYVERPLPFVLHPGRPITHDHYVRIKRMLVRRMLHIDRVEKREREFTEQLVSLVDRRLKSGEPLDSFEIDLLGNIFKREDALLRTFYDREKEFSHDIGVLHARPSSGETHGLDLFGPFRLKGPPEGFSPLDKWAAPLVALSIDTTAPVRTVTIHGNVPDAISDGQTLSCTIAGSERSMALGKGAFRWAIPVSAGANEHLELTLRASHSICPAREKVGGDPRELSYQLLTIELA